MRKKLCTALAAMVLLCLTAGPVTAQDKAYDHMTSFNTITMQGLMLTFFAVDSLSEAYKAKVYDKNFALTLISRYETMTLTVSKHINNVLNNEKLDKIHIDLLHEILAAYSAMASEMKSLKAYMETGNDQELEHYKMNKDNAWKIIERIVNG